MRARVLFLKRFAYIWEGIMVHKERMERKIRGMDKERARIRRMAR
jgi:hypothetical protein